MTLYVFDVDGTLTEPTKRMSDDFASCFARWSRERRYFLTSGSTLATMRRQLPPDIMAHAEGWFPCMGNELWEHGKQVYGRTASWPKGLLDTLEGLVGASRFRNRQKPHIEDRGAMLCFAVPGRKSDTEGRRQYAAFDAKQGERERIAAELRDKYPDLSVTIGGQISIDIAPKGMDKGQILEAIRWGGRQPIVFFADKAHPGGNDYPLAEALRAETNVVNAVFHVKSPQDTRAMLEQMEAHDCSC